MNDQKEVGPDADNDTEANHHQCGQYIEQLRRRRYATSRLPRLDCGCADPWTCRHHTTETINDHYIDGYRDTALHLMANGLAPAPNLPALRGMWRRGGDEQRLAVDIASAWEVSA